MWIVLSVLVWIDVDLKADSGRLSLVHFSFYLTFFVFREIHLSSVKKFQTVQPIKREETQSVNMSIISNQLIIKIAEKVTHCLIKLMNRVKLRATLKKYTKVDELFSLTLIILLRLATSAN